MNSRSEATLVHPERGLLLAFGQGKLSEAEADQVEKHIAECVWCCESLKQVKDDTLVELARAAAANTPQPLKRTPKPGQTEAWAPATHPAKVQLQLPEMPAELRDHPRYRIVERLGEGGMGVVYKAEHRMMERLVALKVISLDFTSHPTAVERFRQEVRAAAKLSHANIVTAHDAEQAGELHFLVMEYVEGVSLAKLVEKKGPLPSAQAALFARQVAQGLHHADAQGMIHRDIKPHNLMVTRKGLVKILDFGLARFGQRTGTSLTKTEMIVGTPDYMAPEQARDSRNVDTRADLYSLGCTLYFLLTGQPPFKADSAISLMFKHCEEDPVPIETFRDDVPAELLAVVKKLMAKKPEQRYQSPAEAAAALLPFLRPLSQSLDLPQRGLAPLPVPVPVEVPVPEAELLEASMTATQPDMPKTPVMSKRLPKRRPRPKGVWPRHKGKILGAGVLGAGLLAALLAWPHVQDLLGAKQPPALAQGNGGQQPGSPIRPHDDDPPQRPGNDMAPGEGLDASPPSPPPVRQDRDIQRRPAQPQAPQGLGGTAARAAGNKVLFVLPEDLWYPDYGPVREVLEQAGFVVETTSYAARCVDGANGQDVTPDHDIARVQAGDFAAIVFVGKDTKPYAQAGNPAGREAGRLLQEFDKSDRIIAAICTGQYVPFVHGYFEGKTVAQSKHLKPFFQDDLSNPETQKYMRGSTGERRVVVDGRLVTGSGPEAAVEFGQRLVRELKARSK